MVTKRKSNKKTVWVASIVGVLVLVIAIFGAVKFGGEIGRIAPGGPTPEPGPDCNEILSSNTQDVFICDASRCSAEISFLSPTREIISTTSYQSSSSGGSYKIFDSWTGDRYCYAYQKPNNVPTCGVGSNCIVIEPKLCIETGGIKYYADDTWYVQEYKWSYNTLVRRVDRGDTRDIIVDVLSPNPPQDEREKLLYLDNGLPVSAYDYNSMVSTSGYFNVPFGTEYQFRIRNTGTSTVKIDGTQIGTSQNSYTNEQWHDIGNKIYLASGQHYIEVVTAEDGSTWHQVNIKYSNPEAVLHEDYMLTGLFVSNGGSIEIIDLISNKIEYTKYSDCDACPEYCNPVSNNNKQCADETSWQYCKANPACGDYGSWSEPATDCIAGQVCLDGNCVCPASDCSVENQVSCDGNVKVICERDSISNCLGLVPDTSDPCNSNEKCVSGECVCDDKCSVGGVDTRGTDEWRECELKNGCYDWGNWNTCVSPKVFDLEKYNNGEDPCVCPGGCSIGSFECQGASGFIICENDGYGCGVYSTYMTCEDAYGPNTECDDTAKKCIPANQCTSTLDFECNPDNPNEYRQCINMGDYLDWSDYTGCPEGTACIDGTGRCDTPFSISVSLDNPAVGDSFDVHASYDPETGGKDGVSLTAEILNAAGTRVGKSQTVTTNSLGQATFTFPGLSNRGQYKAKVSSTLGAVTLSFDKTFNALGKLNIDMIDTDDVQFNNQPIVATFEMTDETGSLVSPQTFSVTVSVNNVPLSAGAITKQSKSTGVWEVSFNTVLQGDAVYNVEATAPNYAAAIETETVTVDSPIMDIVFQLKNKIEGDAGEVNSPLGINSITMLFRDPGTKDLVDIQPSALEVFVTYPDKRELLLDMNRISRGTYAASFDFEDPSIYYFDILAESVGFETVQKTIAVNVLDEGGVTSKLRYFIIGGIILVIIVSVLIRLGGGRKNKGPSGPAPMPVQRRY